MIFSPLAAAASALILTAAPASSSGAGGLCTLPKPTEIIVVPTSKGIRYDYSKSLTDLQGIDMDTIDPHSFNGVTVTQGYTNGAVKLVPQVELNYKLFKAYDAACLWYDKITITIELTPVITIAREVENDRCMGAAVHDHEMKHVRVDREIVNKYSNIIGTEVRDALNEHGFVAGPVRGEDVQAVADRMQKIVFQIVEFQSKKMDIERIERQRAVDNIDEYNRVSAQCPDFRPVVNSR